MRTGIRVIPFIKHAWLMICALFFGAVASDGATRTWDGSSSAYWGNRFNWAGNVAPVDGDTLVFPAGGANKSTINNITGLEVNVLEVGESGYSFSGNEIDLTGSVFLHYAGSWITTDVYLDINLVDNAWFTVWGNFSQLRCRGNVALGSYTLEAGSYGIIRFFEPISGSGSVIKYGSGTVYMEGSSANTYTGTTTVEDGTLVLDQASGNSIPRDLIIEDGATVRQEGSAKIQDDVTIYGSGAYDMNGFSETIDSLILYDGADFDSGTSTLSIRDDVIVDDGISTIAGRLNLFPGSHAFNILYNGLILWPGAHCRLNADVVGSGSVIKTGPGNMRISGNNTYSGTTTVQNGDILIESNTALGSSTGGTTVNPGSRIYISAFSTGSSKNIVGESLSLGGGLYSYGLANSWSGDISLTDDVDIRVTSGDSLELSGGISGPGGVTKDWEGTLIYSGSTANSYGGDTVVEEGTLLLSKTGIDNAINGGTLYIGSGTGSLATTVVKALANYQIGPIPIVLDSDGFLDVDDYTDTVGAITFADGGRAGTHGSGMLRLGGTVTYHSSSEYARLYGNLYLSGTRIFDVATNSVYSSGNEMLLYGTVSGSSGAGIIKTGAGCLTMHGANTYSGGTTINDGVIYARNDQALGTTAGGTVVEGTGRLHVYNQNIAGETLTLNRASIGPALSAQGYSSWSGSISLLQDAWVDNWGQFELSGVISGAGGLIIDDPSGILTLSGSSANAYSGATVVESGTLLLNKTSGNAIRYGSLTIGDNAGSADSVVVRAEANYQIGDSVPVAVNMDGWLDVDDYLDTVGTMSFYGGHAGASGSGTLRLGGSGALTVYASTSEALLDGKLYTGAGTRTFNVGNSTVGYDLRVTADVSGGGLLKTGTGNMALYGSNAHTGETTVDEGGLYVRNAAALGTTAGGSTVEGTGFMYLVGQTVSGEGLTLNRSATGPALYASSTSGWAGDVTLGQDARIRCSSSGSLDISGAINGTGGLYLYGGGEFTLSGAVGNNHSGNTVLEEGTLLMNKSLGNSVARSLVIGGNDPGDPAATARHLSGGEILYDVTVNISGAYEMDNYSEAIRNLTLYGGADVNSGTATLTVSGNIIADPLGVEGDSSYIYGRVFLNGDCTITTGQDDPSGGNTSEIMLYAVVAGSGEITKEGEGEIRLIGANTFSGPFTLNNGTLYLWNDAALGTAANGISVNGDSRLYLLGNRTIVGETLVLNSNLSSAYGALSYSSGSYAWSGNVELQQDASIGSASGTLDISGTISGSGDLVKIYNGTLILSGSGQNTYAGDTRVSSGTLVLNKAGNAISGDLFVGDGSGTDVLRLADDNQINNTADVSMAASGVFDLDGNYDRVNVFKGSGSVELDAGWLIAGHSGSSFTYGGTVSGSGYLWKVGSGTWTLTGNNTYTGTTKVQAGSLLVNGSQPASAVTVSAGATLGGIGTVGNISSSGSVAPGNSAGQLGCGSAVLNSGSSFDVELNGYAPLDYDQLDVGGSVALGGADLNIDWGFVPAVGDSFTIIDNDGSDAVSSTFNGLAEGASVVAGNVTLKISYVGGTGNDVVLAATAVSALDPLTITAIEEIGGNIRIEWVGGVPYYVVEKKTSLTNAIWTAVTAPTRDLFATVPADTTNGFYRVTGGN